MPKKTFFEEEKSTKKKPKKRGCAECGLYKGCDSPRMKASGGGEREILVIAEAPGREEDAQGTQLVGSVGKYLERAMKKKGISLHEDCTKINAVNCRPPGNKKPTPREINCCRPRVWRVIQKNNPKYIILLGGPAVESFLSHRFLRSTVGAVSKWRGWIIPDREVQAYVFPMFHPSYAIRNIGKIEEKFFLDDLDKALRFIKGDPPPIQQYEEPAIDVFHEEDLIISKLEYLYDHPVKIAFDYETTGLKPHRKGHKIVCCGIATSGQGAFAFPITKKVKKPLARLLRNRRAKKICQNMKFETMWSKECLGVWPQGIVWDTMLTSHLLDNRPGITGLKFQSYIHFGIIGYDSGIDEFLRSPTKNANDFNRIREAPVDELLYYCAMDALLTYRLYQNQEWMIERCKGKGNDHEEVQPTEKRKIMSGLKNTSRR